MTFYWMTWSTAAVENTLLATVCRQSTYQQKLPKNKLMCKLMTHCGWGMAQWRHTVDGAVVAQRIPCGCPVVNVQVVDDPFSNERSVHTAVPQPVYQLCTKPCGEVKLVLIWSLLGCCCMFEKAEAPIFPLSLGMEASGFGSVLPKLSVGAWLKVMGCWTNTANGVNHLSRPTPCRRDAESPPANHTN